MSEQEKLQQLIGPDYKLNWVVGHGGMSTVWLADDVQNEREVAVKVLRPEFSDNTEFLSRFRNEALASEQIFSENVVQTYDYRELNDEDTDRIFCFIVMEFIRGESLADLLVRKGSLPEDEALDILEQASHGLAAIHEMGLVHRDIKPGNLMVTQNNKVKITDFGIAKAAESVPLTRTGMVVGTAQYVSPEQAQGKDVTTATDVYSLGVVGYEMLAGKRPFSGDSTVSVAIAHINQAPPPLPTSISAPTRELIGISLRKEPEHRYGTGAELEHAVHMAQQGKRPPQPSAVPLVPAYEQESSATAATTQMDRADDADYTTLRPTPTGAGAAQSPASGAIPEVIPTRTTATTPPKKSSNWTWGIGAALILVALVGGLLYLQSTGIFHSTNEESSSAPVPETVTITQQQQQPTNNNTQQLPRVTPQEPYQESTPQPTQNATTPNLNNNYPEQQQPTMLLPEPPTAIPSVAPTVEIPEPTQPQLIVPDQEQTDQGAAQ